MGKRDKSESKASKKRKIEDIEEDEVDTRPLTENKSSKNSNGSKKAKVVDDASSDSQPSPGSVVGGPTEDIAEDSDGTGDILLKGSKSLTEYDGVISDVTMESLRSRGITSLFEIQVKTFPVIMEGKDVIGRARTGMGKTLSFALPAIEQMIARRKKLAEKGKNLNNKCAPQCLVLAPTRELAKQVAGEFEQTGVNFKTVTVYGGVSIREQIDDLRRGVDIVVGTPGRILDHIERGNLNFENTRHFILDEADQMLDMGFKEDIDKVIESMYAKSSDEKKNKVQILLFSATLPEWVDKVAKERMKNPVKIDLVGDFESASKDVQHLCVQCPWQPDARATLIFDLVKMYAGSKLGRAIVFCDTKKACDELAKEKKISKICRVIHGDVAQNQRESTLQGFRDQMFKILIATDVAARGLDIKNVDLVINTEPPTHNQFRAKMNGARDPPVRADVDTYVHRSGRTGRAGKKGICVTLFTTKQSQLEAIHQIEKKTGNKLKRIGAPQTMDIVRGSVRSALEDLQKLSPKVLANFESIVEEHDELHGASNKTIAGLLALMTGFDSDRAFMSKSILSSQEGFITFKYERRGDEEIRGAGYVFGALRNLFTDPAVSESVKGMSLTKDGHGAVFDLPVDHCDEMIEKIESGEATSFSICEQLPELKEKENAGGVPRFGGRGDSDGSRFNVGRGGGGGSRGGFRGRGRGFGGGRGGFRR